MCSLSRQSKNCHSLNITDGLLLGLAPPRVRFYGTSSPRPDERPRAPPPVAEADSRAFLGVNFACCGVYARIYVHSERNAYLGHCPRCSQPVKIRIEPGGPTRDSHCLLSGSPDLRTIRSPSLSQRLSHGRVRHSALHTPLPGNGARAPPGEPVYSVLVDVGGNITRQDFSAEAWQGPTEDAVGWWKGVVADAGGKRVHWAPNDVMLHYFEQLDGNPVKEDVRYVLALLLVRRRIVRVESTEKDAAGNETLVVYSPRNEVEYRVKVAMPPVEREAAIQAELSELLQGGERGA